MHGKRARQINKCQYTKSSNCHGKKSCLNNFSTARLTVKNTDIQGKDMAQSYITYLACMRLWVQSPIQKQIRKYQYPHWLWVGLYISSPFQNSKTGSMCQIFKSTHPLTWQWLLVNYSTEKDRIGTQVSTFWMTLLTKAVLVTLEIGGT